MNDWKNYKWLVVCCYVLLFFSILLWLTVRDASTAIPLIFIAVLTFTARKRYKRAVKQDHPTINLPTQEPSLSSESVTNTDIKKLYSSTAQIEQRIGEIINKTPNITETEIADTILKEEKEKMLNQVMKNVKIEFGRDSHLEPKRKKTNSSSSFAVADLSYSKIRKLSSNFVVLDFETTGLSHFEDEIIQIAAVRYVNFNEVDKYVTFVKPSKPISSTITKINGITNSDVKNAPSIDLALPILIEFLKDDIIIAHNARFDMKFLLANIYKAGLKYKRFKVVDTLSLARKHIHSTDNHKLPTLKAFLKLDHFQSHEALHDCYVTAELYKYCYEASLIK